MILPLRYFEVMFRHYKCNRSTFRIKTKYICNPWTKNLLILSSNWEPDKSGHDFHRRHLEPLSFSLQGGLRFFYRPLPAQYCSCLTTSLPLSGNFTGLPRSVRLTGWVRCCLYTGSSSSMCLYVTYVHPDFLPFGQSVSTTFTLSCMTVRRRQFI